MSIQATHIIIGGTVFPWAAKAPYVPSGHSSLGALEFNMQKDLLKCHECGTWVRCLAQHIKIHGISAREYKRDRGFNVKTALLTPTLRSISYCSPRRIKTFEKNRCVDVTKLRAKKQLTHDTKNTAETRNLKNLCQAQIQRRVADLAIKLSGTPTTREIIKSGIPSSTFLYVFGMTVSKFMASFGLEPNRKGAPGGRGFERAKLPKGFKA
jgi:hypothetical protein